MEVAGAQDQVVLHVLVHFGLQGGFHVDLGEDAETLAGECLTGAGHRVGERGTAGQSRWQCSWCFPSCGPSRVPLPRSGAHPPDGSPQAVLYQIFTERLGHPYQRAEGWKPNERDDNERYVVKKTRTVVTGMAALATVAALGACSNTATKEAHVLGGAVDDQTSSTAPTAAHNMADMTLRR